MVKAMWDKYCRESGIGVPTHLVYAPKKPGKLRATTEDTAKPLAAHPAVEKLATRLYIEQPYALRFYPIFATSLQDKGAQVYLCAEEADLATTPLITYQDEVGRRIYFQYPALNSRYTAKLQPTSIDDSARPSIPLFVLLFFLLFLLLRLLRLW